MNLDELIVKARNYILSFKDNWDDEGAKSFKEETFDRVASFLISLYKRINIPTLPRISPDGDGEINIHFQTETFELLLGIPESPDDIAGFYGDDYSDNNVIEDECKIEELIEKLLPWFNEVIKI